MGLYIELNQSYQPRRTYVGLGVLKKLLYLLEKYVLFEIKTIKLWKGYPLKSEGGKSIKIDSYDRLTSGDILTLSLEKIGSKRK
ncbi:MAG: hypothetical protein ACTSP3_03705 [Candidatus Heimdallarchaeaceae archaeon]